MEIPCPQDRVWHHGDFNATPHCAEEATWFAYYGAAPPNYVSVDSSWLRVGLGTASDGRGLKLELNSRRQMRSPGRERRVRRCVAPPDGIELDHIAESVSYIGSPEHKDRPFFDGRQPRPRADASICPSELAERRELVEGWLKVGIRRGATGEMWEGGYPRYVWYKDDETVFEARLVNKGKGTYKGYPLHESEWPEGIEDIYE